VRAQQVKEAPEVVRERQVEEHHVVLDEEVVGAPDGVGHLEVVPVPDHAGLRRARRPRGVDVGEEVVLGHRARGRRQRFRVLRRVRPASSSQPVQVGEGERVLELEALDLGALLVVLRQHADRLGMLEDVAHVRRRARRVDGCADRADEPEREVEERPLEPRRA
jgi:hypothetical protein